MLSFLDENLRLTVQVTKLTWHHHILIQIVLLLHIVAVKVLVHDCLIVIVCL